MRQPSPARGVLRRIKHRLVAGYAKIGPRSLSQFLLECGAAGLGAGAGAAIPLDREIAAVLPVLRRTNTPIVVDVGANVGNYSTAIRAACETAKIFAFEPGERPFSTLALAAQAHGFTAFNKGMGAKVEQRVLYDRADAQHGTHASLYEGVITDHHRQPVRQSLVHITTLDAFVAEQRISHIDLLKLDTEGAEMDVLHGARECLKRQMIEAIQFEFNEMNMVSRVFMKDFFKVLNGFDFYRIAHRSLIPLHQQF